MENFIVIFDACVLYPFSLRNLLMYLASENLFKARWTEDIHNEWINSLVENVLELTRERLERTRDLMDSNVPDGLVHNYQSIIPTLNLPDPNDNHVLAAAIKADTNAIITMNLRDFPDNVLKPYDIKAIHPDQFIASLIEQQTRQALPVIKKARKILKNPPNTVEEYIQNLAKLPLPLTIKLLNEYKALI